MESSHDDKLITAIEAGNLSDVRDLLQRGASPNTRKSVTLSSRVVVRHNIWRADDVETKTDVIKCESALALAVLHGFHEIIEELLDNGADIHEKVSWTIANGWLKGIGEHQDHWTFNDWQTERWYATISFPSLLCLALGRCGQSTRLGSVQSDPPEPRPDKQGNVSINHPGANVTIDNPRNDAAVRVRHRLEPRIEVVRVLLSSRPKVGTAELRAAKLCPDVACGHAVESHVADQTPPRVSRSSVGTTSAAAPTSLHTHTRGPSGDPVVVIAEQSIFIERLASKAAKAEREAEAAKMKAEEMEREAASQRAIVAELSAKNSILEVQTSSLRGEVESLTEKIFNLMTEMDKLRAQIQSRSPKILNKFMFAVGNFNPNEPDEIELVAGMEVFVAILFADGWASGSNAVSFGFFPISHVDDNPPAFADDGSFISQSNLGDTSSRVESRLTQSTAGIITADLTNSGLAPSLPMTRLSTQPGRPAPAHYYGQFFGAISTPQGLGA